MRPPVELQSSQESFYEEEPSPEEEAALMQATLILPEQSLSFVEIFLNAALASVLYTRELLKHDSSVFSERCVADLLGLSGPVTYQDFLGLNTEAGHGKSQVFKILVKGRSQRADRILTLLEGGIFDALRSGYLEAVQISICADSSRPSEVVECYTFTFTYSSSSGQGGRDVSSITVSPGSHTLFFVGDAQKSFNAAIKGLLKLIRGLPRLPRRRNLGMNLFYTDDCPASYEPRGFTSCIEDDLCFPGGPRLVRKSMKTSRLVAGAHRIGVAISHVDSAEDQGLLRVVPEDVDYSTKCSRLDEYKVTSTAITIQNADLSSQPLPLSSRSEAAGKLKASPPAPSTQTRDDVQTKEALQQMQRSSSRPTDLMPTQSLVNAGDVDAGDVDAEDGNNPDQSLSNAMLNTTYDEPPRERMIVPAKMAELIIHARALQERYSLHDRPFDQEALDSFEIKRKAPVNATKCECLDDSEEGTMLLCEVCGTWQHQFCYGWDRIEEKYRPTEHVCYSCLLLPEEKDLNDWMPILVACRNTLKYLIEKELAVPIGDTGLIEAMRFKGDPKDLLKSQVMQILMEQRLVEIFRGEVLTANETRAMIEHVDPVASIFHLYQSRDNHDKPPSSLYKDAVQSLEATFKVFALDAIRTHDSFGEEVIRYGYYPRLAAIQSRRKRSASVVEGSQDAGAAAGAGVGEGGGRNKMARTTRKMSRSEMVCFDETASSETRSEEAVEAEDDDEEEEEDMYN